MTRRAFALKTITLQRSSAWEFEQRAVSLQHTVGDIVKSQDIRFEVIFYCTLSLKLFNSTRFRFCAVSSDSRVCCEKSIYTVPLLRWNRAENHRWKSLRNFSLIKRASPSINYVANKGKKLGRLEKLLFLIKWFLLFKLEICFSNFKWQRFSWKLFSRKNLSKSIKAFYLDSSSQTYLLVIKAFWAILTSSKFSTSLEMTSRLTLQVIRWV